MIDIIIPLYNDKKNLPFTLASIAMQTIKDKVIVYIIDDCSTDNYNECLQYFKNDIKLNYFKLNTNSGPGIAREYGINVSNSEYICFMDSDDLFYNPRSLELLYKYHGFTIDFISGIEYSEKFDEFFDNDNTLHAKLYSRNFIYKNKLHFNASRIHEDCYFNSIFNVLDPISININEPIYFYSYNINSLTSISSHKEFLGLNILLKNLKEFVDFSFSHNCNQNTLNRLLNSKQNYLKRSFDLLNNYNDKVLLKKWIKQYHMEEFIIL